ncbi:MAG: hypothetical protein RLZZ490_1468 [Cyanobacteriota bacterium]
MELFVEIVGVGFLLVLPTLLYFILLIFIVVK